MQLTQAIKRAPRWAWITAAGVGLGAAGIKLWTNRAKEDEAATATEVLDPSSPYPTLPTSTGNPVATIVPPVIISQNAGDANQGVGALQDLYVGAVSNLISGYQDLWGPVQTTLMTLTVGNAQTIQDLAIAGSAPNSATPLPAAITPFAPVTPSPPVALPVPRPAPKPCGGCKPPYPFCNEAKNKCYTVACASGKGDRKKGKWHLYANPADNVWMGSQC